MSCKRCRDTGRVSDPNLIGFSVDCPECMSGETERCDECGETVTDCDDMRRENYERREAKKRKR